MLRSRTNASANRAELQWALSPAWHPPQTNASCLTLPEASSGAGCASCNDRRVTLGLLYFDEPEVLRSQLANWATWPPAVQRRFDFVVVDDCSQRQRSAAGVLSHSLIDGMPDVRVLTILPPKRAWNIGGGRNLIMHLSRTCWVLICDLDYRRRWLAWSRMRRAWLVASKSSSFIGCNLRSRFILALHFFGASCIGQQVAATRTLSVTTATRTHTCGFGSVCTRRRSTLQ